MNRVQQSQHLLKLLIKAKEAEVRIPQNLQRLAQNMPDVSTLFGTDPENVPTEKVLNGYNVLLSSLESMRDHAREYADACQSVVTFVDETLGKAVHDKARREGLNPDVWTPPKGDE